MAYKSFRSTVTGATGQGAVQIANIFTALLAMGWELHDTVSATDKIFKSNGELGTEIYQYIRLNLSTETLVTRAYGWWDNSGHAGTCASYGTINSIVFSNSGDLILCGDKNLVFIRYKGTTNYVHMFGHVPKRIHTKPLARLTGAVTAGANANIAVDDPTGFRAGCSYQIFGAAGEGRDWLVVNSVVGNTLVVANLPRNYGSNSSIGAYPSTFFHGDATTLSPTCTADVVGTAAVSTNRAFTLSSLVPAYGPDYRLTRYSGIPLYFYTSGEPANASAVGICDTNLLMCAPSADDDNLGVKAGKDETGQATSGTSNTLTDSGKAWSTNQWAGYFVIISQGTGQYQSRQITSNTGTALTTTNNFTVAPDLSSQYFIVEEAYRASTTGWNIAYKEIF